MFDKLSFVSTEMFKFYTMKRLIPGLIFGFLLFSVSYSQKYAYVDTDYILDNIPEYKDAQQQLDDLAKSFQEEVEEKRATIDQLYKNFQAEAVLMPDDVKKKKQEDIQKKEDEVRDFQNQKFGPDGELFQKREELIKPIQEKIYNAIEEIATDDNYAFVFDRAGSLTILYVNAKYDISDDVLDKVGAELGTVRREDRVKKTYEPTQSKPQNGGRSNNPPKGPGGMSPVKRGDRK